MIRFGCAKDAAAVYRLICALEDAAFPRARFDQLYLAQCADERIFSLVWEEDGEVIGFANVRMEDQLHHCARIAEIMELAVEEGCRGRGIGTVLFDRACALSAQAVCRSSFPAAVPVMTRIASMRARACVFPTAAISRP